MKYVMNYRSLILCIICCLHMSITFAGQCFGRPREEQPPLNYHQIEGIIDYNTEAYENDPMYAEAVNSTRIVADRIRQSPSAATFYEQTHKDFLPPPTFMKPERLTSYHGEIADLNVKLKDLWDTWDTNNVSDSMRETQINNLKCGNCGEQAFLLKQILRRKGYTVEEGMFEYNALLPDGSSRYANHGAAIIFRGDKPYIIADAWGGKVIYIKDSIAVYGKKFKIMY